MTANEPADELRTMTDLALSAHAALSIIRNWMEGEDFGADEQSIYDMVVKTLAEANSESEAAK